MEWFKERRSIEMKPAPISAKDRIVNIDIIRGFALLGIFLVNMPAYHSPDFMKQMYGINRTYTGVDYWVDLFFQLFVQMKFYTIFSFLFGLGFYLFMSRAEQKGLQTKRLFTRRLLALLLFGVAHLTFLWFGDILHTYAIAGIFLLFFYKRKNKTLLIWAFSLFFLIHALMSIQLFLPADIIEEIQTENASSHSGKLAEYVEVYEQAPYLEWTAYRLDTEIKLILANLPITIIPVLAMFLLGLYAGRMGVFHPASPHQQLIKKTQLVSFLFGIPFVGGLAALKLDIWNIGVYKQAAVQLLTSLSGFALCFFYLSSLLLLLRRPQWQKRLQPLGGVGQMALTNYLSQTIICIFLFVGLGLYGRISLAGGTIICFIIYTGQVLASRIWLQKYRFGPLEWLWRSFTYGKFQPMKKDGSKLSEG
jgi:uncharacterized protein